MACEADLSELEQQQEPLATKEAHGPRKSLTLFRGALVAAGALLLLGVAALALHARPSSVVDGTARETADLIQRYALEKNGRTLTQEELARVQRYVANAKYPRFTRNSVAQGALKARLLQDDMSAACEADMKELMGKVLAKVIQYVIEAMGECADDDTTDACKQAEAKIHGAEEEIKDECKSSGDVCKLTETKGDETEEEEVCMPKSCHDEMDEAGKTFLKQAGQDETHDGCDECTAKMICEE